MRGNQTDVGTAKTVYERCLDQGTVFAVISAAACLEIANKWSSILGNTPPQHAIE